jgi:hypothetical protein
VTINSRTKGRTAETELAKILFDHLGIKLERNLNQTRAGGYDLEGLEEWAIEVKRQETLQLNAWWNQATNQAEQAERIPVLAYRQSRKPWRFVLPAYVLDPGVKGVCWQYDYEYSIEVSLQFFCYLVRESL